MTPTNDRRGSVFSHAVLGGLDIDQEQIKFLKREISAYINKHEFYINRLHFLDTRFEIVVGSKEIEDLYTYLMRYENLLSGKSYSLAV